ncbi:zinc finger protein aebp2-like isoform X2 [Thalassophryne amazonica]|nr:zinc finger protein aebp2-like isoform X2 [Thalassophryne amazonica]
MAEIPNKGIEPVSQRVSGSNGSGEVGQTGTRLEAVPEPEQEPGDTGTDPSGGHRAADKETPSPGREGPETGAGDCQGAPSPVPETLATSPGSGHEGSRVLKEQRAGPSIELTKPADRVPKRRNSVELDSEDSISSTLMDMESTVSSGRSTPAMLNGHGGPVVVGGGAATASGKSLSYTCCWDHCQLQFTSSPDLAEHIRATHVEGQRGGVFVCLWKGCKVYNTPSTSPSWLQRHMLTHSGDKPFKCVVGGCNATFASQGGLARHVPTHFSSQNSSKLSNGKMKEESPSKAGLNKRKKLKNKHRRSLPRPHDFFDAQTMDAIRHRAICLNLVTHIESMGNGHSVVFRSTVIAKRKEDSGKVKVLLHWMPEDILPDVWVNESEHLQQETKVVHLSKLPADMAVLLDPNVYR